MESTCAVSGCDEVAFVRGLCHRHYARWQKHGDPGPAGRLRRRPDPEAVCEIERCQESPVGRGLCQLHYDRWRRTGVIGGDRIYVDREGECEIDGCSRAITARRLCSRHYGSLQKYGDPLAAKPKQREGCHIEHCDKLAEGHGLCAMHYGRWKATGDPYCARWRPEAKRPARLENGYRLVWDERRQKYTREHRLVMEAHLDRDLLPAENVHHRNGVRTDNRLSNLELWTRPQPTRARVVDLVEWARELLALYEADVDAGVIR